MGVGSKPEQQLRWMRNVGQSNNSVVKLVELEAHLEALSGSPQEGCWSFKTSQKHNQCAFFSHQLHFYGVLVGTNCESMASGPKCRWRALLKDLPPPPPPPTHHLSLLPPGTLPPVLCETSLIAAFRHLIAPSHALSINFKGTGA